MLRGVGRGLPGAMVLGWRGCLAIRGFRGVLLRGVAAVGLVAVLAPQVFRVVQDRPGVLPPEPVLGWLGPAQLSVPIFAVQYAAVVMTVWAVVLRPVVVVRGLHALAMIVALRMTTIALVPLNPPPGLQPLVDPVNQLVYPGDAPLTRDLFFSGHTAVMVLLVLLAPPGWPRRILTVAAFAVAVMLLAQHAHWTIDVLAAPLFVALAWWLSGISAGPGLPERAPLPRQSGRTPPRP